MTETETPIKRTPQEIHARIEEVAERDTPFGAERSRLLEALPLEEAQRYLRSGHPHTAESWEQTTRLRTVERVKQEINGYLPFAWMKANESRGSSAIRAVSHFRGLLWLLGEPAAATLEEIEDPEGFNYYGKPWLVRVSSFVGFDWQKADNDQWVHAPGEEPITAAAALGL